MRVVLLATLWYGVSALVPAPRAVAASVRRIGWRQEVGRAKGVYNERGVTVYAGPEPTGGAPMDPTVKLLLCLAIDLIGMASFAAPVAGEAADVAWAPVSAFLVNYLFGNSILTSLAFVEELLPGFDVIPTATIAWVLDYLSSTSESSAPVSPPRPAARRPPRSDLGGDDVIDV